MRQNVSIFSNLVEIFLCNEHISKLHNCPLYAFGNWDLLLDCLFLLQSLSLQVNFLQPVQPGRVTRTVSTFRLPVFWDKLVHVRIQETPSPAPRKVHTILQAQPCDEELHQRQRAAIAIPAGARTGL